VSGHDVVLIDTTAEALSRAQAEIQNSLERLVNREKISEEDAAAALARVVTSANYDGVSTAELVIEAVYESPEAKRQVWQQLAKVVQEGALLATNASSLSGTEIASYSGREARMVGLHFFNPVAMMALVEVVRGLRTDQTALDEAKAFVE